MSTAVDPGAVGLEVRIGRVARENASTKALRLLTERAVMIRYCGPEGVRAFVRGSHGSMYRVILSDGRWSCDCAATGRCSHLMAVQSVTLIGSETPKQRRDACTTP